MAIKGLLDTDERTFYGVPFHFFFKINVTAILGVKLIQGHMKTAYETLGLGNWLVETAALKT